MPKSPSFNPSLRMPIIDIIVAIILMVATGYFWFHSKGEAKLEAAFDDLKVAREANAVELADSQASLEESEQELRETIEMRDAKAQFVEFLLEQIEIETQTIADDQELDELYTNQVLDLRTDIQRGRDRRLAYNSDILETNRKIEEEETAVANLESQAGERNDELGQLDIWIANARQQLEKNPPSRFPANSALASLVEIKDENQSVLVSLSHEVRKVQGVDFGLLGSLGLTTSGDASIKEGGLYANLPIANRRASIDFEGGVSQFESREEALSDTSPFAGANVRFAPNPKERVYVIGGARYSHEDLALRVGLALGRR